MATTKARPRPTSRNGRGASSNGARHDADPRLDQRAPELQRFGTLRTLPIGLPDEARRASCETLNEILADSMVLYSMYKKHHWLVAGPTFYQLHLLFDKHAEEQNEIIDALAERVQSLGGIAVGDPRHAAELTSIPRPPDGAEEVAVMIDRTLFAKLVAEVASLTLTRPASPPTERITFLPRDFSVATSALNWSFVYPPSAVDSSGSTPKLTAPGVLVDSANARAITS